MKKNFVRIIAAIIAILMAGGLLFQLLAGMWGSAAAAPFDGVVKRGDGTEVEFIRRGNTFTIEFIVSVDKTGVSDPPVIGRTYTAGSFRVNATVWERSNDSSLSVAFLDETDKEYAIRVTVSNLKYISGRNIGLLELRGSSDTGSPIAISSAGSNVTIPFITTALPASYFESGLGGSGGGSGSSGGAGEDGDESYSSNIIIESVIAKDDKGNIIERVTKDTPSFTVEVVYTDRGLWDVSTDEFSNNTMFVYLIDTGPLIPNASLQGTLRRISSGSGDPPRFRAAFSNITYSSGPANFEFRVHYDIYGYDVMGSGKARLFSAASDEDEDEEKDTAPPTPYIIISQYDLGREQIEAGSTFTLALNFGNTSRDIAVENIIMVINPVTIGTTEQSYLSIASATNTYYYEGIAPGGNHSQSVDILVKGTATVGSQAVSVEFTYEYVVDKARQKGNTSTTIYVPITQIDRFSVDPITDFSSYMTLGDEGYATVSFVNHGKSSTYNISGFLLDDNGNQGQTEHYGNLDPGAHGTLDFVIVPSMPGDFRGNIVIGYEDENGERKEVSTEFTAFVEERWFPPPPGLDGPGFGGLEPESAAAPWWRYALFAVGGLALAAPLAFYLAKRVKAKGSEDFDEDY